MESDAERQARFWTIIFRRAKLESVRQRKQVSEILGEALERYLAQSGSRVATSAVAAETWGILKLDRRKVDRLMADGDDEDGLLDA